MTSPSAGIAEGRSLLRRYHFIDRIAAHPFVDRIILYGSRARGNHHDRSDIDLAIACPRATVAEWADLLAWVDEHADTLLAIDLVRLDALPADDPLRSAIDRDCVVLFQRTA